MSPEEVVREAIEGRHPLFLVYRNGGTRVVQPHALYRAGGGRVFLDGYQVAGESSSGALPGWREFDLAQTSDIEPLAERFEIAPGFDPGALRYRGGALAMVSAGRRAAR